MACNNGCNDFSIREELLAMVNELRKLPTEFDIRLYNIIVRVTTYTGTQVFGVPGEGTKTVVETPLYLDGYGTRPKVSKMSTRDIIASGGLYTDADYKVEFITPQYNSPDGYSGVAINIFEPDEQTNTTQIDYVMTGPEFPQGALFKKIKTYTDNPFNYHIVLRKTGVQP